MSGNKLGMVVCTCDPSYEGSVHGRILDQVSLNKNETLFLK
jgi:hypothetical protein